MTTNKRNEIAAFRYGLIADVVNRFIEPSHSEIRSHFAALSKQIVEIPYSTRKSVSIRSLERYKEIYEKKGYEGLLPKKSKTIGSKAIPKKILELAETLRKERPERSVEQIIFILENSNAIETGTVSQSTLSRHLKSKNLSRIDLIGSGNSKQIYQRFETLYPHQLWQSDFKHAVYLTDPLNNKNRKRTKLCAIIDDNSRYIVHAQFYWDEKMPTLEDCLKKAILKHGTCEQFYCDNGSAFSSKHLSNICARLGIKLSHSVPYRPVGRGKIERFFQFIDSSFIPEAYEAIEKGNVSSLDALNSALNIWLEGYYHQRKHGTTNHSPDDMIKNTIHQTRNLPSNEVIKMFFVGEERKVDKTGCISINGVKYDVGPTLSKQKIEARFDPFVQDTIEIWQDNQYICMAKKLDATNNFNNYSARHHEYKTSLQIMKKQTEIEEATKDELPSFIAAATSKMHKKYEHAEVSYQSKSDIQEGVI